MAEKLIYERIKAISTEIGALEKDRRNGVQNYNFRGIDDVYNAAHELFAKNGVFTTSEILDERSEEKHSKNGGLIIYRILKIRYTFHAEDGSSVASEVIGEGMDSGDKASNKAMAVAHKYAILQILMWPTEEAKDPENDSHDLAGGAQAKPAAQRGGQAQPKQSPAVQTGSAEENIAFREELQKVLQGAAAAGKVAPEDVASWLQQYDEKPEALKRAFGTMLMGKARK